MLLESFEVFAYITCLFIAYKAVENDTRVLKKKTHKHTVEVIYL